MSEESCWLAILTIAALTVTIMTAVIATGICYHRQIMVEHGYEEVTVLGNRGPYWQKVR